MTTAATARTASHLVVLDGGGKVTLSGGGKTQILSMNAGWEQQWPQLVVQNLTFTGAYSGTRQVSGSSVYGGGAIFAEGGQLKVVNSTFTGNSCYASGPDLGGGAIRAVGKAIGWGGAFQDAPGIFDSVNGQDAQPVIVSSSVT